jgi:hypothetical protein
MARSLRGDCRASAYEFRIARSVVFEHTWRFTVQPPGLLQIPGIEVVCHGGETGWGTKRAARRPGIWRHGVDLMRERCE